MKYPKLNSLVPQGEHFDESAVSGEGVWLTTPHVSAIETALSAAPAEDHAAVLDAANASIATMQSAADTAAQTIATQAARITALETENATLGAQSSGTGTALVTAEDTNVETGKQPSYLSDNNPANEWLDKKMKRKSASA